MNIPPYKKKRIMDKQIYNIKLNDFNEIQNLNYNECRKNTSNINNLEIYNILRNGPETINNSRRLKNYKLDNNNHKINHKFNSIEKKLDKNKSSINNYLKKSIDIGIEDNQYKVKNININFNNIRVVNNIS